MVSESGENLELAFISILPVTRSTLSAQVKSNTAVSCHLLHAKSNSSGKERKFKLIKKKEKKRKRNELIEFKDGEETRTPYASSSSDVMFEKTRRRER